MKRVGVMTPVNNNAKETLLWKFMTDHQRISDIVQYQSSDIQSKRIAVLRVEGCAGSAKKNPSRKQQT
jgi:hypothetical protein